MSQGKSRKRPLITTNFLGFYKVPQQRMKNPGGGPIIVDHDILGKPRNMVGQDTIATVMASSVMCPIASAPSSMKSLL